MQVEYLCKKKLNKKENEMRKEVIILTQADGVSRVTEDSKLKELKKEVEEKTGKEVILLYPGMTVECIDIDTKD
jgi:hypothetical protein